MWEEPSGEQLGAEGTASTEALLWEKGWWVWSIVTHQWGGCGTVEISNKFTNRQESNDANLTDQGELGKGMSQVSGLSNRMHVMFFSEIE